MSYIACLFLDRNTSLNHEIAVPSGIEYVRVCTPRPFLPISIGAKSNNAFNQPVKQQVFVYRRDRQVEYNPYDSYDNPHHDIKIKYIYDHTESTNEPIMGDDEAWNVGFQEPDATINLDRLARKCKKRKKVKDLLLRYYAKN